MMTPAPNNAPAPLLCAFCATLDDIHAPVPAWYIVNGHSVCHVHIEEAAADQDFARALAAAQAELDND